MSENTEKTPERVLITKIGMDGHDRGSRIIAAFLRDAGMEVIYTPPWQAIDAVVNLAVQEDVEVIGVSSLATDHLIMPDLMKALKDAGQDHIEVIVGGIVPDQEHQMLLDAGVAKIFGPGAMREEIVDTVRDLAAVASKTKFESLGV